MCIWLISAVVLRVSIITVSELSIFDQKQKDQRMRTKASGPTHKKRPRRSKGPGHTLGPVRNNNNTLLQWCWRPARVVCTKGCHKVCLRGSIWARRPGSQRPHRSQRFQRFQRTKHIAISSNGIVACLTNYLSKIIGPGILK